MTELRRDGRLFRLGSLTVGIDGTGDVAAAVRTELGESCALAGDHPQLRFRFEEPGRERTPTELRSGPVAAGPQGWSATYSRLHYRVALVRNVLEVDVSPTALGLVHRRPLDRLTRWGERSHLNTTQLLAKDFLYTVFDGVSQTLNVDLGQSWVHGAAATCGDRTVLLTGSGGSGKTTGVLDLVLRRGWRYLSDDLALVDADGLVHRSPKRLQVYAYNVSNDRALRRVLFADMHRSARMAFVVREHALGKRLARHRIAAQRLFGEQAVASTGQTTHVIHLRTASGPSTTVTERSPRWLAERSAAILVDELQPLDSHLWALRGLDESPGVPDPLHLHSQSVQILEKAFAQARGWSLDVPSSTDPSRVAAEVYRLLERS